MLAYLYPPLRVIHNTFAVVKAIVVNPDRERSSKQTNFRPLLFSSVWLRLLRPAGRVEKVLFVILSNVAVYMHLVRNSSQRFLRTHDVVTE